MKEVGKQSWEVSDWLKVTWRDTYFFYISGYRMVNI